MSVISEWMAVLRMGEHKIAWTTTNDKAEREDTQKRKQEANVRELTTISE